MADGYTDFLQGTPAGEGQAVRAVSDSGYGSSPGNAMEMVNWINKDSAAMGSMSLPVMRVANGKKNADLSAPDTYGFWCKKSEAVPGIQPKPRNRVPYNIEDAHFAIAAVSIPGTDDTGVVFQASKAEANQVSELAVTKGQPQARWIDAGGRTVELVSPARLNANAASVIAFTSAPGAQSLRVNTAVVANGSETLAPSVLTQMLIGWGFVNYYPRGGFMGNVYSVIAGKGSPSAGEMAVLERYLGSTAGVNL
jgi:hypothetical protein